LGEGPAETGGLRTASVRGRPTGDPIEPARVVGSQGSTFLRLRCIVADPRPLAREAIRHTLTPVNLLIITGEAAGENEALRLLRRHLPDVAVIAHSPPLLSGEVIVDGARRASAKTRLLLLVDPRDLPAARKLMQLGAAGCLPLSATPQELIAGVIAAGFVDVGAPWDVLFPSCRRRSDRVGALTISRELSEREAEVLQLLADGNSAKQIATKLFITTATVRTHLARTYDKLGTSSSSAAVAEGFRRGLIG
jgi:two-component system, NarL family, nitrate/nitrite response regulator NarL